MDEDAVAIRDDDLRRDRTPFDEGRVRELHGEVALGVRVCRAGLLAAVLVTDPYFR